MNVALDRKQHKRSADFDSAIRRFDPSHASQLITNAINVLELQLREIFTDSMLHYVARIPVCFQGLPKFSGGSVQHGCNMIGLGGVGIDRG
jgi:hypothetical protein